MDLQQEWQNMNIEIAAVQQRSSLDFRLDAQSNNLTQNLLFKLKWKLRWIRIIDLPILVMALCTKGDIQISLILLFLTYEGFRFFAAREYAKIKTGIDYDSNIKKLLEDNLKAIKMMLKIENIFGYVFLPISGLTGWLFYKLYRLETFEKVYDSISLGQIVPFIIVGIPFIWVAKKMNDSIFKQPIQDLKNKVSELAE
jgi:hypothetical protein